jgi:tellurite resistance protein TerC
MGGNELFSPLGIGFIVFLIAALAVDFGLLRKNGTHVVPVKEAAAWTLVWIVLAIIFGFAMQWYWGDATKTTEYFVGYLVEKSLSVDNIFVFTIIFAALKTPKKLQQLALMWGILLALVLRGIMILIGAALIERFEWIIWVFGGFLLLTGVQMLRSGGHASEGEPSAVKLARRFIHVNNDYNEERFWIVKAGRRVFTPIFLTIAVIGIIDLVFAVDSIPAIFGITLDPFIVFTSNAFAILGLRNLYFLLADAKDRFRYLSVGLAFVLMWIGVKMILPAINHDWKVPPLVSLVIVLSILTLSIVASWMRGRKVGKNVRAAQIFGLIGLVIPVFAIIGVVFSVIASGNKEKGAGGAILFTLAIALLNSLAYALLVINL